MTSVQALVIQRQRNEGVPPAENTLTLKPVITLNYVYIVSIVSNTSLVALWECHLFISLCGLGSLTLVSLGFMWHITLFFHKI